MIKNKRQYAHTKKQATNFREAVAKAKASGPHEGVHPKMHQAYIDGMEGELELLDFEIAEYEHLARGNVETIELDQLEKLPQGLIKARIARGLSHKELAAKLNVKPQQVQRWEFEDYENVGFRRLVEIAEALDISVSESIHLPKRQQSAMAALRELGIDRQFLMMRLVPRQFAKSAGDYVVSAAERLSRIFGIELLPNGMLTSQGSFAHAAASLRFKLPANAENVRVKAYAAYAAHLADLVAEGASSLGSSAVPTDWSAVRAQLFGDGPVDFTTAVQQVWQLGIPVLPLSDPVRMHGCCMRVKGRNVIVLKQSIRYTSRWLFDLIHELHHASEHPQAETFTCHSGEPAEANRRESDDEFAANEFAGNVLLSGTANELYEAVLARAGHQVPRLKAAAIEVAESANENVGILANYIAFRLKADHFVDWWGAAANLQPEGDDAVGIARDIFMERFSFQLLSSVDRELLEQALSEPEL